MEFKTLILDTRPEIATITLNRPEKRNAISAEMIAELLAAFDEVESSTARVLILTGAGKAFCSGMDLDGLKALAANSPKRNEEDAQRIVRLVRRLWSFPKPVIAAVNGHAIAGGCGLATVCDFTLAVPEAKFGYPETRIGFLPATVSIFLGRLVGEKQARDLLLTGRTFDSEEALRLGIITRIVPAPELMQTARDLATTLIACSPVSLKMTKKMLCDFAAPEVDRELKLAAAENVKIRRTEDFREGISSFLEKRDPQWRGK